MAIVTAFDIAKQHYEAEIEQLTRDLEAVTRDRDNWKVWHTEGARLIELQRNGIQELNADLEAARAEIEANDADSLNDIRALKADLAEAKAEIERLMELERRYPKTMSIEFMRLCFWSMMGAEFTG